MPIANQVACEAGISLTGGPPVSRTYREGASQTFRKGEMVILSGGFVVVAGADPALILGFAAEDAHNSTPAGRDEIAVDLALPLTAFIANIFHPTAASAITAQTDVGALYGITTVANKTYVDKSKTLAAAVRVIISELDSRDAVGDRFGKVVFCVLGQYCQLHQT